jgi:hypothetical protein
MGLRDRRRLWEELDGPMPSGSSNALSDGWWEDGGRMGSSSKNSGNGRGDRIWNSPKGGIAPLRSVARTKRLGKGREDGTEHAAILLSTANKVILGPWEY